MGKSKAKRRMLTLRSVSSRLGIAAVSAVSAAVIGTGLVFYFYYDSTFSPGWHTKEEGTYYIVPSTHERAVGMKLVDNSTYLFDENGYILTGWQDFEGNT